MKLVVPEILQRSRLIAPGFYNPPELGFNGAFQIMGPNGRDLRIIASDATVLREKYPWEHVSVSLPNRCPNWPEMCFVKDIFWDQDETVVQFHPPVKEYVNYHPYCLHLWKPINFYIELPPSYMIAPDEFKGKK